MQEYILTFLGVVLVFSVIWFFPPDLSQITTNSKNILQSIQLKAKGDIGAGDLVPTEVLYSFNLKYPSKVTKDSTILVYVKPEIEELKVDIRDIGDKTLTEYDIKHGISKDLWRYLKNKGVTLTLNLPSAKISPDKINSFSEKHEEAWSVYLPAIGAQEGYVSFETTEPDIPMAALRFRVVDDNLLTIKIDVHEALFSLHNLISFVGLLLGSGIIFKIWNLFL